jgi:RHH-type transcriptional regulator, proline utilization regulon repressor / proline dehydrogenase / delta 1-pyrroline-5-carboxylate dehydrogenase
VSFLGSRAPAPGGVGSLAPFRNEPLLELRRGDVRARLTDALAALDARAPLSVPIWIGDEQGSADRFASSDPGDPDRVVAWAGSASEVEVALAVEAAVTSGADWGREPAQRRASALLGAAAWMRVRRLELAALAVRECAKPWPEADADVCEAIDYLELYAREALRLEAGAALLQAPGELNTLRYAPRGVTAVIAPWNFPLAIPTGMTAAALAAGNAVVLKPAEQSPACAVMVLRALRAGGVPPGALALLPGAGEVGAALVRHPSVRVIAFTGSQPVGLEIIRAAAEPAPGQGHIKQVIAELGGKNCVIVDADADLDLAVPEIVASAFGYAGQKCSAAARVLVHEVVADRLLERLAGATSALVVGQAAALATDVPPLIEEAAQQRVRSYMERGAREGRIVAQSASVPSRGWFAPATLIADVDAGSPLLSEEIFGPLLTVERVADAPAACAIVEALPVGLTGGLFSRDPATVAEVTRRLPVGNLYVNRRLTGAMVARQPFGGTRLSGTGAKAGGSDYLMHFLEPRVISENTTRHGLVV